LFTFAGFCHYIQNHFPAPDCCLFTSERDHPLLWYALEHFGLELEFHEDPILLYYKPVGGLGWHPFPLWATLLHKMLSAIRSEQEEPPKLDWQKTILAMRPLVEQLAVHTDWPYADGEVSKEQTASGQSNEQVESYLGSVVVELSELAMMCQRHTITSALPLTREGIEVLARKLAGNYAWDYQGMREETIEVTILRQPSHQERQKGVCG
jgi:hypothetical protein